VTFLPIATITYMFQGAAEMAMCYLSREVLMEKSISAPLSSRALPVQFGYQNGNSLA
jgi:hypothetical protein